MYVKMFIVELLIIVKIEKKLNVYFWSVSQIDNVICNFKLVNKYFAVIKNNEYVLI